MGMDRPENGMCLLMPSQASDSSGKKGKKATELIVSNR